ncbi:hypothetical protein Agub_g1096, partial [Astrephomene gubernaculifera]
LLCADDLCALLRQRVARLPVEQLEAPALECFKACWRGALWSLREDGRSPHRDEGERAALGRRLGEVQALGRDYLWQIVLDCQRPPVTAAASHCLLQELYGGRPLDMISDTRQRLMDAAALLTPAPTSSTPTSTTSPAAWARACSRATRCLQLLEQLAGKDELSMPPVPAHGRSWQGSSLLVEVGLPEAAGRVKLGCAGNEYVGLLRRRVAAKMGVEPACVRLVVGGQELRSDSCCLASSLPPAWSPRQALLAHVSPRPNRYSRFGEGWWAEWHAGSSLAHLHHD